MRVASGGYVHLSNGLSMSFLLESAELEICLRMNLVLSRALLHPRTVTRIGS